MDRIAKLPPIRSYKNLRRQASKENLDDTKEKFKKINLKKFFGAKTSQSDTEKVLKRLLVRIDDLSLVEAEEGLVDPAALLGQVLRRRSGNEPFSADQESEV